MDINLVLRHLREMLDKSTDWLANSPLMDLQTTVICAVVFVISALVVYLISVFGIKGQTYEEAIAQQRRRNKEAMQLAKHDKNRKDKRFRRWSRKSKDQDEDKALATEDAETKGLRHLENKLDSETRNFSPEYGSKAVSSKKKKKRGKAVSKSCLPQPTSSDDTDEQRSHSENERKQDIPEEKSILEDVNVETEQEAQECHISIDHKDEDVSNVERISCVVHDMSMDSEAGKSEDSCKKVTIAKSPNKKNKRNKAEQPLLGNTESGGIDAPKMTSLLKNGSFTEDELNAFFDALSSRQDAVECWTLKNDLVPALKKQIQEKEEALESEQKLLHAANEKLKNMRQINQEKSRAVAAERSLREKVNQLQQEIQNMHSRLKMTHDQHVAEMQSKMQQMKAKLTEEHNITLQRMKEENSQLQALNRRESEKNQMSNLEISRLKHEIEQLVSQREQYESRQVAINQRKEDLHHQIQQLESHIEKLVTSHQDEEFTYKQRLNDMRNNLQQADKTHSSIVQELQNAQSVCSTLEADNNALRQRLEETKLQITSLEQDRIKLQTRLEEMHQQQREMAVCIDQMQNEVSDLKKNKSDNLKQIEELRQENEALVVQLADSLELQPNNLNYMEENAKMQEDDEPKTIDLMEHQIIVDEKEAIIQQLQDNMRETQEKYKEIIAVADNVRKQTKSLLRKLFPAIEIEDTLDCESWLEALESQMVTALDKIKEESIKKALSEKLNDVTNKLNDTIAENAEMKQQVSQYKKVLAETENMLYKLQCSAEKEEKKWKEDFLSKEKHVKEISRQNKKLLSENKALQANLAQLQELKEMQSELVELQSKLQVEEEEKLILVQKYGEAIAKLNDLQAKLQGKQDGIQNDHSLDIASQESGDSYVTFNEEYGGNTSSVCEKRKNSKRRGASKRK